MDKIRSSSSVCGVFSRCPRKNRVEFEAKLEPHTQSSACSRSQVYMHAWSFIRVKTHTSAIESVPWASTFAHDFCQGHVKQVIRKSIAVSLHEASCHRQLSLVDEICLMTPKTKSRTKNLPECHTHCPNCTQIDVVSQTVSINILHSH